MIKCIFLFNWLELERVLEFRILSCSLLRYAFLGLKFIVQNNDFWENPFTTAVSMPTSLHLTPFSPTFEIHQPTLIKYPSTSHVTHVYKYVHVHKLIIKFNIRLKVWTYNHDTTHMCWAASIKYQKQPFKHIKTKQIHFLFLDMIFLSNRNFHKKSIWMPTGSLQVRSQNWGCWDIYLYFWIIHSSGTDWSCIMITTWTIGLFVIQPTSPWLTSLSFLLSHGIKMVQNWLLLGCHLLLGVWIFYRSLVVELHYC